MTVYANGLEVACKAQSNKVIAAFPDVCFTPPENPATPPGVPVPYPSFGMDSDTDSGTGTVKIGGETITQKNKSYYTKTTGTEAGCAAKKGVITSVNTGKEYAVAWSGNVKADGEPVNRFSDISTNNHASPTGQTPPFPKIGKAYAHLLSGENCLIGSYDEIVEACSKGKPPGEAHHIVPDKVFRTLSRAKGQGTKTRVKKAPSLGEGVCICLRSGAHDKIHAKEREKLNGLGQAKLKNLSGAKLEAAKQKASHNTADMADIHAGCKTSLDTLKRDDGSTDDCIKKAKAKINKQADRFPPGQIGRTSNNLPNPAAKAAMLV